MRPARSSVYVSVPSRVAHASFTQWRINGRRARGASSGGLLRAAGALLQTSHWSTAKCIVRFAGSRAPVKRPTLATSAAVTTRVLFETQVYNDSFVVYERKKNSSIKRTDAGRTTRLPRPSGTRFPIYIKLQTHHFKGHLRRAIWNQTVKL